MRVSTAIYRAAAHILARSVLRSNMVRSLYLRRSVAVGEAAFPFSDVDIGMVIKAARGPAIGQLWRQYKIARALFPWVGECLIFTEEDMEEFAVTDPYRAYLDGKFAAAVSGPRPQFPSGKIPPLEAGRRLIFWFDNYIPIALRRRNGRNLRKFALEIANALGVLEGWWEAPLPSRRETLRRLGPPDGDPFEFCCRMAARAHRLLLPPAPRLREPLELKGILVIPKPVDAYPASGARVLTPEALDLMLQTQEPTLWWEFGKELEKVGFSPPSPMAWQAYARRCLGGHRLHGPGFSEAGTRKARVRLCNAARILGTSPPPFGEGELPVRLYYERSYDRLREWAACLWAALPESMAGDN